MTAPGMKGRGATAWKSSKIKSTAVTVLTWHGPKTDKKHPAPGYWGGRLLTQTLLGSEASWQPPSTATLGAEVLTRVEEEC